MAKRMIFGAVLSLALSMIPQLAQAFPTNGIHGLDKESPGRGLKGGYPENNGKGPAAQKFYRPTPQVTKAGAQGGANLGLKPLGPSPLAAFLPAAIGDAHNRSPLPTPRYSRFEPGNLSDRLLEQAQRYLHAPYRRGSSLQTGQATDCSGFVQYIYKKANISLPRASGEQARAGKLAARHMDFSKLAVGDLLFFRDGGRHIGHVGIYLGEGKMIHAASHSRGVTVSDLRQDYYRSNFVVAKRLLAAPPGEITR